MAGAAIAIDNADAADTVLSVKERVFTANPKLYVRRQRLVYTAGPRGMDALADDETLGGAGVAQDGSAKLDVLLADLTPAEAAELGPNVCSIVLLFQRGVVRRLQSLAGVCLLRVSFGSFLHVAVP